MGQKNNKYTPSYNFEFTDDHTLTKTDPVEAPLSVRDVKEVLNRKEDYISRTDLEQGNLDIVNNVAETDSLIDPQLNFDLTNNYGCLPEQNFISHADCPEGFWGRFCKRFGFRVPDEYKIWLIVGFIIVFSTASLILIYTKNINLLKVIWYTLLCFLGFFECNDSN